MIITAIKCDKKKKPTHTVKTQTEKEICVYGNVMVHRCPRRSHMETGRTRRKKRSRRERGKRGREIEK